ncbi:outer membrane beta-barrel protein [Candidatus Ruminimicrobiellum ovillum]|uniref:outer membrane beta-barrel protein n=1 Tax=Candidatus Ruminimicrobiellum ovillum TaxID=1947927 RepID=UPI003559E3FC
MKKLLAVVLLAAAMVAPAFAAKGDMSVNAKLGLGVNNNVFADISAIGGPGFDYKFDMEMPVSLGAEFFYGLMDNLSVGLGVNYGLDSKSKSKDFMPLKVGTTNIYAAIKPEAKIDSNIFSSIYLIGQIGLAMGRAEIDASGAPSLDIKSGLYLGFGIGTTIMDCIIVELVCSSANLTLEKGSMFPPVDMDVQYTATTINVGYKFAL